jgi:shikimate kinase
MSAPRPLVVLIGPSGAGKTTISTILAARLGVPARDTDVDVEVATGMTVSDIFLERGEPEFRELEHAAVLRALVEHDGILALGGGAVVDPRTEVALGGHSVVFLDVQIADATRRIGLATARPLLVANPRAQLTKLLAARRPVYERDATAVVNTSGHSPDEVADAVLAYLEPPGAQEPTEPPEPPEADEARQ